MDIKFIGICCKSNIWQRRKKCLIFNFQDLQTGRGGNDTQRPPARTENYCESKQTYFSYSLHKAFHLLEFQAKLFFTRNRVGGFYWDSLLIIQIYWTESVSPSVLFATMYEKQTCYVYFLSECTPSSSFYVVFENSDYSKTHSLVRSGFSCTDCSSKEERVSNCENCTFCMVGSYAAPEGSCIPCPAGTFFF